MKILNKIISLTMAVIMMLTATPVLQAADFTAELDRAELNELKKEIKTSIIEDLPEVSSIYYNGIPDVKTIKERYAIARENYEQNLKAFAKQETKQSKKDYERYIDFLKQEAKKRIKTDSRFDGFKSEREKEQVAFYTVLLEEMENSKEESRRYYGYIVGDICVGLIVGIIVGAIAYESNATIIGEIIAGSIGGAIAMFLMFTFVSPSKPVFSPSLFPEEAISAFLVNPFSNLALFDKRASDSEMFYSKSNESARLLYDAVNIEYYTSLNPSVENLHARLYTQTIDWHYLTTEQRADYIHNLAGRLRAEAK